MGKCTHILRHMRMCCKNGSVFWKKSINMGPIYHEKYFTIGQIFKKIFWGLLLNFVFLWLNCKKWVPFFRKNPEMWVPICRKTTPEQGYGSWAAGGTSPTNPSLKTPGVSMNWYSLHVNCCMYFCFLHAGAPGQQVCLRRMKLRQA